MRALTYGSILLSLSTTALEGDSMSLVLETLGSDEALDAGSLGVGLLSLTLGLNLTADDELADLNKKKTGQSRDEHRSIGM